MRGALSVWDGECEALGELLAAVPGRLLLCTRLLVDVLVRLVGADGRLAALDPVEAGRLDAEAETRASLGEMAGA